ncbi:hypothetical protein ACH5RR_007816 [Cinchona calisaya]|uniref:Uncharacterized protein n=1 Tax=Cinchona calisaya TaxID=153742 RepID=A0ABD3A9S6_9GENT
MACSLQQTLIRTTKAAASAAAFSFNSSSVISSKFSFIAGFRNHYSTHSQISDVSEAEALAVRRIEDAIHRIIVKQSAPDWLPFVPGASYWVPPKRRNYGIEQIVHKLANTPSDEEVMSLTTSRGWPSSAFYSPQQQDEVSDQTEAIETSNRPSLPQDEEG